MEITNSPALILYSQSIFFFFFPLFNLQRPSTLSVYSVDQYDPGYDPGYDQGFEDAGYDHTVQPKDYWCMSLNVTLFCCLPLGLLALVKSSDVSS